MTTSGVRRTDRKAVVRHVVAAMGLVAMLSSVCAGCAESDDSAGANNAGENGAVVSDSGADGKVEDHMNDQADERDYWFAQSDGADVLAVGDGFVFVGGAFSAVLLAIESGEEVERIDYEGGDEESESDPEDQFLSMFDSGGAVEVTIGSETLTVTPGEGLIGEASNTTDLVALSNPLSAGDFTVENDLSGLVVSSASGGSWRFAVSEPMFDETSVVALDGWAFVVTADGRIVALRLTEGALNAAQAAWGGG